MADSGIPARRSAAFVLERILDGGKLMSELTADGVFDRLDPPDRARAQRLAQEVLRNMDRADALIARHVPKAAPLPIQILLRLGAVELAGGAAGHGVVNDLVSLASRNKHHNRAKGMVNAVLRKLVEEAPRDWDTLPVPRMPRWLRQPLVHAWGRAAVAGCETAHHRGAPLDLTAKADPAAVAEMTGGTLLPTGSVRVANAGQVTALNGYAQGHWWVQDAAAALPAKLIRGEKVLDLCAAPGGKTLQLSAAGHHVTSVDISPVRMERVGQNLERTGLKARLKTADAFTYNGQWDAVLLDAPCSATGTMRRHPDLPFAKDGSDFATLIDMQARLIDHALTLVKPGGQLVFCTCSLLPDEGEVQVEEALARHKSLTLDTDAMDQPWVEDAWRSPDGGLRLRPDFWADRGGMDGFYIAALRKGA